MGKSDINEMLERASRQLSAPGTLDILHEREDLPQPSNRIIKEFVTLCRAMIFPGFYGDPDINSKSLIYKTDICMEKAFSLLWGQILSCSYFDEKNAGDILQKDAEESAKLKAATFLSRLPRIREILMTDVQAVFEGDPAARGYAEVISCYPAIYAITNYRIAHELLMLDVPLMPRIITERAHSKTGIDIHPGATIGSYFAIDHGTGVVIGETCIIGDHVKLYQGVTLGAKSFPLDEKGQPIKGIPRHPILEDGVIIYSNATILGRITIGKNATIGGNIWVTRDVAEGERITQKVQKD